MSNHYAHSVESRRIDPSRRPGKRPDGTPDDNDRAEIGLTQLAFDEWAAAGIEAPDLAAMRAHRHARLVAALGAMCSEIMDGGGAPRRGFSIKLADQVLVTETGVENLTRYRFDARLLS